MSNDKLYQFIRNNDIKSVINEIKLGADDYSGGLWCACVVGNIEIFKLMISYGTILLDDALIYAVTFKHILLSKFIIELGVDNIDRVYEYRPRLRAKRKEIMSLLEFGLDISYFKPIKGYNVLVSSLDKFKTKTTEALSEHLLDPIISIIHSYSLL